MTEAEKLPSSNDLNEVKSFVEKIATNRLLRNKEVFLDFTQPFDLIQPGSGVRETQTKQPHQRGGAASSNVAACAAWWRIPDSNR